MGETADCRLSKRPDSTRVLGVGVEHMWASMRAEMGQA